MKLNLGRMDFVLAAVMLAALAFISWQVNQTAHAVAAMTTRPHVAFAAPIPLNPSLSSHLQPIPYCDGPSERAQNGSHGDDADGDDDGGPFNDEPDDPSQDVFPT